MQNRSGPMSNRVYLSTHVDSNCCMSINVLFGRGVAFGFWFRFNISSLPFRKKLACRYSSHSISLEVYARLDVLFFYFLLFY